MTIIAFDGKRLASDTAEYKNGMRINTREKLHSWLFGSLANPIAAHIGFSGNVSDMDRFVDALGQLIFDSEDAETLLSKLSHEKWDTLLDGFEVVLVVVDGVKIIARQITEGGVVEIKAPYVAGLPDAQHVAMGAMLASASAPEAVFIASKLLSIDQLNSIEDVPFMEL